MFFISAAIVTKSTLTIKRCPIDFLELELEKLKRMGQKYTLLFQLMFQKKMLLYLECLSVRAEFLLAHSIPT
jgi:UDP-N-acetylglucosamine enolpyruvyl transferase